MLCVALSLVCCSLIYLTVFPDLIKGFILDTDLVWSDPEDVETWAVSPRGAGWLFGARVANEVGSKHTSLHKN